MLLHLFISSLCDACEGHATSWSTYEWSWGADAAGTHRVNARALTEALDAMRELSSLHVALPLLASTGLVNTFKQLACHQVGSVETTVHALVQHSMPLLKVLHHDNISAL